MKKLLGNRWFLLSSITLVIVLGLGFLLGLSPWWLRPNQPLENVEAVIVEGFLSDETMCEVGEYLLSNTSLLAFTTGTNRSSMVWRGREAGTIRWELDHESFSWQEGDPIPSFRMKGHGQKCNGFETIWKVKVNDETLFEGEMPTYQAREFTYQNTEFPYAIQEVEIGLHHPNPGPDCRWILWYVFLEGMEDVTQRITFIPDDKTKPVWPLPATLSETGKNQLMDEGLNPQRIMTVPIQPTSKMRTLQAAISLKHYLLKEYPSIKKLNILTGNLHARRSWECYQYVFQDTDIEVGVKRFTYLDYSLQEWWTNPEAKENLITQLKKYFGWRAWKLTH